MLLGVQNNTNQTYPTPSGSVVVFDPIELVVIELENGLNNSLNVTEVYSEWKVWQSTGDNAKYPPAFRYVGGDAISAIQDLGITVFLRNGWRFRPAELNHRVTLVGNIFTEGGEDSIFVQTLGGYTVLAETKVSNLVDSSVAQLDLDQLQEFVYIDTINGISGTTGTIGSPTNPSNNLIDAVTISLEKNLRAFSIIGSIVLDRPFDRYVFKGTISSGAASVDLGGYQCSKCRFEELTLSGDGAGMELHTHGSELEGLFNVVGDFSFCSLTSITHAGNGGTLTLFSCYSNVPGTGTPSLDMTAGGMGDLQLRQYSGGLQLFNLDDFNRKVTVDFVSGHLKLDNSCTDGELVLRGVGLFTNNSGPGLVINEKGFAHGGPNFDEIMNERLNDLHSFQVRSQTRTEAPANVFVYTSDGGRVMTIDENTGTRTTVGAVP